MQVLVVNTSQQTGGAAIAARRLVGVLGRHGVKVRMLVAETTQNDPLTLCATSRWRRRLNFIWERFRIFIANGFSRRGLWRVDIACAGTDITQLRVFQEADIIHLHWINQGFLSMKDLQRVLHSGKPVVWTLHDMWPFTGVCHHAGACACFHTHCADCPQLCHPSSSDLSYRLFKKKLKIYKEAPLTFVGCSRWITEQARLSTLTQGHDVLSIPNTFPAAVFHPVASEYERGEARSHFGLPSKGRLLLFACQKVTAPMKGIEILVDALSRIKQSPDLAVVVVGELAEAVANCLSLPVHALGYVSGDSEMARIYHAVDVFVTPSLEENLPNTIMEAMACGTPCVGFEIGGIPEMIAHQEDGYVARYRDIDDLAAGIDYVLADQNHSRLASAAASKALHLWGEEHVVRAYQQVYESLCPNDDNG